MHCMWVSSSKIQIQFFSNEHFLLIACLFMIVSAMFDYYCGDRDLSYIGEIGFQSTPPLDGVGVFNMPEGDSPQNTEPPLVA